MLHSTSHRPYAIPDSTWVMRMAWESVLFMHWRIDPEVLRPLIPEKLEIDTFDGQAWIGVVPFIMTGVTPRWVPELPWVSCFPELNVRTYVVHDGKPGVWFFSLDAGNPLAVWVARKTFHLPYFNARMKCRRVDGSIVYRSERTHRGAPLAVLKARYRPVGEVYGSAPGNLDYWLTERYCLYSANPAGRVYRGDIHHAPWPLQNAEAELEFNSMVNGLAIELLSDPPLCLFAEKVDVVAWPLLEV